MPHHEHMQEYIYQQEHWIGYAITAAIVVSGISFMIGFCVGVHL